MWFSQSCESPTSGGTFHAVELPPVDRRMMAPKAKAARQSASPPFRARQYYNSFVLRTEATPPHSIGSGRSRALIDSTGPQTAQRVRRLSLRTFSLLQKIFLCHWCGRRGPAEERCWLTLGACSTYGGADHSESRCTYFSERSSHLSFKCSICLGGLLGKDFPVGTPVSEVSN